MRGAVLAIVLTGCSFDAPSAGGPGADAAVSPVDGAPGGQPQRDAAPDAEEPDCDGYTGAPNGRFYLAVSNPESWGAAGFACIASGGALAIANDRAENAIIRALIADPTRFWLGMSDGISENTWIWLDGSPVPRDPAFWDPNQPNDANTGEDCGEMSGNGFWNDDSCDDPKPYVCECD